MAVVNLTEARIRAMSLGSGYWWDEQVKGLLVQCHKSCKTYYAKGDVRRNRRHVRTVKVKIDRVDRISLSEARRRARALMSQIQGGVDPTARAPETGVTLGDALEQHIRERDLSPRTVDEYRGHMEKHLGRLRRRAVADVSRQDVRDLFDALERRHGRVTAGQVLRTVRLSINTARRIDETIGANPVDALVLPATPSRRVDGLDLAAWWEATGRLTPPMRDLHRTFLLTGARRASVLPVRRDDVDPARGTVTFRHMKRHGLLTFPLGAFAAGMLAARLAEDGPLDSAWLWPSATSGSGHVEEPKRAGLPGPHALRHHARTLMIAAGVPYAESALLLGHALPGASGRYVHPAHLVEHLRPFVQAYEDLVLRSAGVAVAVAESKPDTEAQPEAAAAAE